MSNRRVKITKIENVNARQVTFSKRKKGLFKKAKELSVLCDVEVAAIVFSHAGKLHHYSSTSTDEIISRYRQDNNMEQSRQVGNEVELSSEFTRITNLLSGVVRDGILDMGLDDLERLETILGSGLGRVGSLIKEAKLCEENLQSHQTEQAMQMQRLSGMSKSNVEAAAAIDVVPRGEEDSPIDTILRLG